MLLGMMAATRLRALLVLPRYVPHTLFPLLSVAVLLMMMFELDIVVCALGRSAQCDIHTSQQHQPDLTHRDDLSAQRHRLPAQRFHAIKHHWCLDE